MGMRIPPELEAEILSRAEPRAAVIPEVTPTFATEAAFQAAIVQKAREWGWLCFHTYDSRRCEPGFPDLILLRRDRMIAAELKRSRKEKPSPAQRKWLRAFQGVSGANVYIWSPEDWDTILKELS